MLKNFPKNIFLIAFLLIAPFFVKADTQGQKVNFSIDKNYDVLQRQQLRATLVLVSAKNYFYIEDDWWETLAESEKQKIVGSLNSLGQEFADKIYPKLTQTFGSEWMPGIDNDFSVTVLFHRMKDKAGGYFNSGDEYSKLQNPTSNLREMVYLNTDFLNSSIIKSYLAHEFTHLIAFNQKERILGKTEEVWLNEARAEYSSTLAGLDDVYEGSNLQLRVKTFIDSPSDSLTEWRNQTADYGVINLFAQYLVDNYGTKVLVDSLQSPKTGIDSINYALKKQGVQKDFSQVFENWTIALFLGDCKFGPNYCYRNQSLKNFKISPSLIFLPSTQKTEISSSYSVKEWSGNWYRIIGGEGNLQINFTGSNYAQFRVPYILCQDSTNCKISFMTLDSQQNGGVIFSDFGKNYTSFTLIPLVGAKLSGFGENENFFDFSLSIIVERKTDQQKLIEQLQAQVVQLKTQIASLLSQINAILNPQNNLACARFKNNLSFGMTNNAEVRCLQQFLRSQGQDIYPEGLITGNFLSATKAAVIRFQEKYGQDILAPLGLTQGTGFVGKSTLAKVNQLLGG